MTPQTGIGVLIGLLALLCFLGTVLRDLQRAEDACRRTAQLLGGTYRVREAFLGDVIRFDLVGKKADLTRTKNGILLEVDLPGRPEGLLGVAPDAARWDFRPFGPRFIPTGDADFDRDYAVSGLEETVRLVFAPGQGGSLKEALHRSALHGGFRLEYQSGTLRIWSDGTLGDSDRALALAEVARALAGVLCAPDSTGIVWGDVVSGRCPVCSTALVEPLTYCFRCQAPHHRECWDYLGRCAIYGCEPRPHRRAA